MATNNLANPTSVSEWLTVLAEENAKRRKNRQVINSILVWTSVFFLLAWSFIWFTRRELPDIAGMAAMLALIGSAAGFTARHKTALSQMREFANRESAGYLLEAYATSPEKDIREIGEQALPLALSRVESPEDLDDYQCGLLYKQLNFQNPPPLVAAALECIGLIAGKESIPLLEKFHQDAILKPDPEWQRLGHRALQLLPDVRIRVARVIIEKRTVEIESATEASHLRLRGG